MKTLKAVTRVAADLLVWVAAFGLVLMTVIIGWQVFGRYVLNASPNWSEQTALTLMIWFVTLAAAAGVREGFHIRIQAVEDAAPRRFKTAMRVLNDVVVGVIGVAMAVYGAQLVIGTWDFVIPTLGLPRGFAYMGLPIAGALIALFSVERIIEEIAQDAPEDEEDPRWS